MSGATGVAVNDRRFDLICLGRAAVDLYGEQIGARLEDQTSFAKYLGGCPANIAVGSARLGLDVAMLTRVGDEHNGRFVRETLAAEGIDVSHVHTDPRRLTALVFLSIKDRVTFPLLFYRHDCADMGITEPDFDAQFIGSARALLTSGTHFSQPETAHVCFAALRTARAVGTRVVFDIDYRPVLWKLTSPGLGERRYVESHEVTAKIQEILPLAHLVIGTDEEFHIAGGSQDTIEALRGVRRVTPAMLVLKRGPMGCAVFPGEIPDSLEAGVQGPGFPVEVFNILGAGDAFAAGFLSGWLRDAPLEDCCARANACGAIVVSRHGCAPAMPAAAELDAFLARSDWPYRLRESKALEALHRSTTRRRKWPEVLALAFDHRRQLEEIAGEGARAHDRIRHFKRLVAQGAREAARGVAGVGAIVDARYGEEALHALTGSGLWLARPVERPGCIPLEFESGANVGAELRGWPAEQTIKCLAFHHPDDDAVLRETQLARLAQIWEACVLADRELLVEVILPQGRHEDPDGTVIARALEQIYAAGVRPEWWKLAPPASAAAWLAIENVLAARDPHCRGVLLLGLEASEESLERGFAIAAPHAICKGFAVGRSIFMNVARRWFAGRCDDAAVVREVAANYSGLIARWRKYRPAIEGASAWNASAS